MEGLFWRVREELSKMFLFLSSFSCHHCTQPFPPSLQFPAAVGFKLHVLIGGFSGLWAIFTEGEEKKERGMVKMVVEGWNRQKGD